MPCFYPIKGFRAPGGEVRFSRSGAYRDLPITVSCGNCWGCRLERSRQWAVRCVNEAQMHERNCFITLTYDEKHLPPDRSLQVSDWQDFAKRTRKKIGKFRYMHCGEYGEKNGRPHYHASIFGWDLRESWELFETTDAGDSLYTSPILTELWPNGLHAIGELTFESAAYVARYIMKKITGDKAFVRYGEEVDQETGEVRLRLHPEYTTMSRKPGIGKSWIDKYMDDVYPSDEVIVNGRSCPPPKYYDQQYEKINPKGFAAVRANRVARGESNKENSTYWRLATRETCSKAKMGQFIREL